MAFYEEKKLYDRIVDRLDQKKTDYEKFNIARDSIKEYFRLDLGTDAESDKRGEFFGRTVYEATGAWAARTMAKFFQGSLVSPSIDWIKYVMREFELRGIDELDIWCQDIKEHLTAVYRRSNYYEILPNYTLDGVTIGSPVIFVEESDVLEGNIKVINHHYKHCFLYYDKYGDLEGLILKDPTWTAKQIDDRFGGEGRREGRFSLSLINDLKGGNFNKEYTIIRAVFKVNDPMWKRKGFRKPAYRDLKWISVYFEELGPSDKKDSPLAVEGFSTRPFMTWNYNRLSYEVVSRTPAYEAIYDVCSQQQVYKNFLENAQLKNRPPVISLSTLKNKLELWPEGVTYVEPEEFDRAAKMLDMVGDVLFNKDLADILGNAIRRHFMIDTLMRFSDIAKQHKQPLTVYQLWKIAGENSTLLSPAIETYSRDLLGSVDDRFVDIEMRAGRGPFEPERFDYIRGIMLDNLKVIKEAAAIVPEFIGPLPRAQRLQQAVDPIINGIQTMLPAIDMIPELVNIYKPYELGDEILQATDFPASVVRTKDDYEAVVQMERDSQMQQQQFDNTIEAVKAAKDVSGPVDQSSVLAAVAGGEE